MCVEESKDFSVRVKRGGKVPAYVIGDKCNHGPPSPAGKIAKKIKPQFGVLFFSFFMFCIFLTPLAILIKLNLFSDEFFVLA